MYLNLDNNKIYTIPMLKLLGTSHLKSETWLSSTTTTDTPIPGTSRIDEESKKYDEHGLAPFPVLKILSMVNNLVNVEALCGELL